MTAAALNLHPDRLLPADPTTRDIARRLYAAVHDLPIISPHGHVPAAWIADDIPFGDPTSLLISPDHYVVRLLHANGVPMEALGVGGSPLVTGRGHARRGGRSVRAGTPSGARPAGTGWRACSATIFGVTDRPSAATADAIYDQVADTLQRPDFRPRALLERFGIEVLATTDDPCDDLSPPRGDRATTGTSAPACCRPSAPTATSNPAAPTGPSSSMRSAAAADTDTGDYKGYLAALEDRRRHFKDARGRLRRPQPRRRRAPSTGAQRGRAASSRPPVQGEALPRTRRPRCAGTCSSRWRACRSRTAW